jgi:hypothetical protein
MGLLEITPTTAATGGIVQAVSTLVKNPGSKTISFLVKRQQ